MIILKEDTFDINKKDIDLIYKEVVKLRDSFFDGKYFDVEKIKEIMVKFNRENLSHYSVGQIHSSELTSPDVIKANSILPINIYIGVFEYNKYSSKGESIYVGFPKSNLDEVLQNASTFKRVSIKQICENLPKEDVVLFKSNWLKKKHYSTIAHELSHWIDDALHNLFISRYVSSDEDKYFGSKKRAMSYMEINAQIHSIKELKTNYSNKEWDKFTFEDVAEILTTFYIILEDLTSEKIEKQWLKKLFHRMNREDLLGKNMRSFKI